MHINRHHVYKTSHQSAVSSVCLSCAYLIIFVNAFSTMCLIFTEFPFWIFMLYLYIVVKLCWVNHIQFQSQNITYIVLFNTEAVNDLNTVMFSHTYVRLFQLFPAYDGNQKVLKWHAYIPHLENTYKWLCMRTLPIKYTGKETLKRKENNNGHIINWQIRIKG